MDNYTTTLKIWFTDFWPEWKDEDFITPILSKHFDNIVLDKDNPDVLFHSIFGHSSENWSCPKILYLAENIRSGYNPTILKNIELAFKAAIATITFDPETENNFRLPLWQVYLLLRPELKEKLYNRVHHDNFDKWGSFVVSNPSNFMRNSAYQMLNGYKRVNSYGKLYTNDNSLIIASQNRYWRDAKYEFFNNTTHKFMMAYENTPCSYYCTEKLMDAFLAGSVPIYWGDPKVNEDWNEKAFINATKGNLLETIKLIDTNDKLFQEIYNEPVFTNEQKEKLELNLTRFEYWLIHKIYHEVINVNTKC